MPFEACQRSAKLGMSCRARKRKARPAMLKKALGGLLLGAPEGAAEVGAGAGGSSSATSRLSRSGASKICDSIF